MDSKPRRKISVPTNRGTHARKSIAEQKYVMASGVEAQSSHLTKAIPDAFAKVDVDSAMCAALASVTPGYGVAVTTSSHGAAMCCCSARSTLSVVVWSFIVENPRDSKLPTPACARATPPWHGCAPSAAARKLRDHSGRVAVSGGNHIFTRSQTENAVLPIRSRSCFERLEVARAYTEMPASGAPLGSITRPETVPQRTSRANTKCGNLPAFFRVADPKQVASIDDPVTVRKFDGEATVTKMN